MHLLEIDAALEPSEQEQRVARVGSHRSQAAKHGLDMIDRVVALPCALIGVLPLLPRHPRVSGGHVIEVVPVQVGIERGAGLHQPAVVLAARQRREIEKFQQVDRQFPLDDVDVVRDRRRGVVWESENVAGIGDDTGGFPGEQHLAIFGDLVLAFLRAEQIVGIDVFQSDEHPSHARPRAFLDEIGKLVAERIHLDDEADIELLDFAQVYQAVEDRLPVFVAGKIVVGDEETAHAFGVIEAHDLLDIGGRAPP